MSKAGQPMPHVRCSQCDRTVAGYVPKGGDGSGMLPIRHKDPTTSDWCDGRFDLASTSLAKGSERPGRKRRPKTQAIPPVKTFHSIERRRPDGTWETIVTGYEEPYVHGFIEGLMFSLIGGGTYRHLDPDGKVRSLVAQAPVIRQGDSG
jgi:hypothetical protein